MLVEHLREMVTLASTLNIASAAHSHYITAATLSRHVSAVESELGVQLFQRDTHHMVLTDAGKSFIEDIRPLLEDYGFAVARARAVEEGSSILRVGFLPDSLAGALPPALLEMRRRDPSLRIQLYSSEHEDLVGGLLSRRFDVVLTMDLNETFRRAHNYEKVGSGRFCAVFPIGHLLAERPQVSPDELCSVALILPDPDSMPGCYQKCLRILDRPLSECTVVQTCADLFSLLISVEMGLGVSLVPEFYARRYREREAFVPLSPETDAGFDLGAFWQLDRDNPTVSTFVRVLKACMGRRNPKARAAL